MTTAMRHGHVAGERNPALLPRGTFVFLWAPGDDPTLNLPDVAIVDSPRAHAIVGENLTRKCPGAYPIGEDVPPGLRWHWEVAAPPRQPAPVGDIEHVEGPLSLCARIRLICGEPGLPVDVRLRSGDIVHGTLTKLITGGADDDEAEWAEFTGAADHLARIVKTVVRVAEIAAVTRRHS